MTHKLSLIELTAAWQTAFLEMAAEYTAFGELRYKAAVADFDGYLQLHATFAHGEDLPAGRVRETCYWGVVGKEIIGGSRLRHSLTPALRQIGGHIGYNVRPSMQGQGYGTLLLALTLEKAHDAGLPGVLITCDADNSGSVRVIEKNGGRLLNQSKIEGYDKMIARYWIDLPAQKS